MFKYSGRLTQVVSLGKSLPLHVTFYQAELNGNQLIPVELDLVKVLEKVRAIQDGLNTWDRNLRSQAPSLKLCFSNYFVDQYNFCNSLPKGEPELQTNKPELQTLQDQHGQYITCRTKQTQRKT